MMKNMRDRKSAFYRALDSLEEILKKLVLTEQMGHFESAGPLIHIPI